MVSALRTVGRLPVTSGVLQYSRCILSCNFNTTSRVNGQAETISTGDVYTPPEWTPKSRRTGVLAFKKGMITAWSDDGKIMPITVLQMENNQVVQAKTVEKEGKPALQIGCRDVFKLKKISMPQIGHFKHAGVQLKRKLVDFRISEDAALPVGTHITAAHFVPGQFVDVCSISKGKGFQGGIKRHNMNRQPATHGNSRSHRKMGGTGGCQDPGRVFPGKRMPGHLGNERVTTLNLRVYRVEPRHNLIYVIGAVPGHKEQYVQVKDAHRKTFIEPPPFPTHIPAIHGEAEKEITADLAVKIMRQA
eukprot:CFRG6567T1